MIKELIKTLKKKESELVKREVRSAHRLREELADLPRFYGFESMPHFIKALKKAASGSAKPKTKKAAPAKRKRAKMR
jgi:hypothetical protein